MRDIDGREIPPELAPILQFLQDVNNRLTRYVDQRCDEMNDGVRLLVAHLQARQVEHDLLRARIEAVERQLSAKDDIGDGHG